jgi:hypothetical protein
MAVIAATSVSMSSAVVTAASTRRAASALASRLARRFKCVVAQASRHAPHGNVLAVDGHLFLEAVRDRPLDVRSREEGGLVAVHSFE